jgi:hypothetical protein
MVIVTTRITSTAITIKLFSFMMSQIDGGFCSPALGGTVGGSTVRASGFETLNLLASSIRLH